MKGVALDCFIVALALGIICLAVRPLVQPAPRFVVQYFGMVVESQEGAAWKATDMERALRLALPALLGAYGEPEAAGPLSLENRKGRHAIFAVRKVLADIDSL